MLCRLSLRIAFLVLLITTALSPVLRADIYQWEWINPADPSQGKQQSTTLCPDGAGLIPAPGLDAIGKDLTQAYLIGANLDGSLMTATLSNADLTGASLVNTSFRGAMLAGADLTGADLTGAYLYKATFNNANLTGTTITGAYFSNATDFGFTQAQFESTASYASGELTGIDLSGNDLSSWNFASKNLIDASFLNTTLASADLMGANLTNASLRSATLTNVNLTGATIAGVSFYSTTDSGLTRTQFELTASYASGELTGIDFSWNDLSSWDFAGKNLTDVTFSFSTLTNMDLTGATIAGVNFAATTSRGFTRTQFESTASYASGELAGINLDVNDLSSWNFAYKNLTNASLGATTLTNTDLTGATITGACFSSTTSTGFTRAQFESTANYASGELAGISLAANDLSSWNFSGKNLTGADFRYATLTDVNLTGTDARTAVGMQYSAATALDNFVKPDGRVEELEVTAGQSFRVWDFDGVDTDGTGTPDTMLGITVGNQFAINADGLLIVGLEDDQWGSTISFDAGIDVTFDGILEVELRDSFVPTPGDQWQLFDFTGVTPTGDFDIYVLPDLANGQWDTSRLMSDGVLSIVAVPGDANGDGRVDGSDVTILAGNWQVGVSDSVTATWAMGDFNGDGQVDGSDVTILAGNWQAGVTTAAAVPEPSTILLLVILFVTSIAPVSRFLMHRAAPGDD